MKNLKLGSLSIPITQFASQGNAVLGIRDSGKSYSATYLAEQLYAAGIPFVAFDPSGVWKFLRVPGAGAGLPIVVAGGKVPDLPLTPQSAPEIVRAAMRANVSLVLDLYDIHMSKADWSRIVESCVRVLLYENGEHGLRHIFIEEAAEFCPQQVSGEKAKVYAEVEKLARIGGNALLGYTLINQRAEQVNKAVLELCDCLLLHRQKGKNSLNSLSKWLEYSQGGDTKEIIKGLPTLPSGECWVWPAGAEHASHVKMPQKNTFHPDRRALIANPAAANVQRIDASKFVAELRGSLEKYVEEAKANDPAELKKRVRELERQVAAKPSALASPEQLRDAEQRGYDRATRQATDSAIGFRKQLHSALHDAITKACQSVPAVAFEGKATAAPSARTTTKPPQIIPRNIPAPVKHSQTRANGGGGDLPGPQQKILDKLSWLESKGITPAPKETLAAVCDVSPTSGGYFNNLGKLRSAGLIDYPQGGTVAFTDAGRAAANPPTDDGRDVHEHWLDIVSEPQRKILAALIDAHPDPLDKDTLAEIIDVSPTSGGYFNNLGRLRTLGAIDYPTPGKAALTKYVMPE